MKDRLLTLDNLYEFYSTHKKSCHFSAEETGEPIVVQSPGKIIFSKDNTTESLTAVRLQACHTSRNLNNSSIDKDVMENIFLPTFKNRPILAYIYQDDNGEFQFYDHRMHKDENGEIVYDEFTVGIIPETNNASLEYDQDEDHYNVMIDGYIFDDYTQAKNIIEREGECAVSVEIAIKDFSYSAKDKVLIINDGFFSGVTILGKNPDGSDVLPGMKGSNIKLKDFSLENNSMFSELEENKLIQTLDKLNETLSKFNIQANAEDKSEKGGQRIMFEELLEKYNKTLEDVTFEYENLSDEELEIAFSEAFSEDNTESEQTTDETVVSDDETTVPEEFNAETETTEEVITEEFNDDVIESEETPIDDFTVEYSAKCGETTKTYSVSLNDKIYALQQLINDTYYEDGDWYSVEVYEDTKTVVFHGWIKSYRQTYKVKNDVYSLVGDRVEIHAIWVTDEEEEKFENMKANYSSIESELATYKLAEEKADKLTVFEDENYVQFIETDEFKSLMSEESILENTKEQLHDKAELAFAKLVKAAGSYTKQEVINHEESTPTLIAFAKVEENDFFAGLLNKKN